MKLEEISIIQNRIGEELDLIEKNGCYFRIQRCRNVPDRLKVPRNFQNAFLLPSATSRMVAIG